MGKELPEIIEENRIVYYLAEDESRGRDYGGIKSN